jgi:hypothetical protein
MLSFKLTPHHTGFALWGDYPTLNRLHAFVHEVVTESSIIEDKESFVLGLAYDARKAFEGQRSENYTDQGHDRCKIFGVEILWPVVLVQVGILRHAMAFMPTSRLDQATMFELEHVVESAVRSATPGTADAIIHQMRQIGAMPYQHIEIVLDSRCRYFIERPATKRLAVLSKLMETFDPMYLFLAERGATMRPGVIKPTDFDVGDNTWPDFKW